MGERNPMALWPGHQFKHDKKLKPGNQRAKILIEGSNFVKFVYKHAIMNLFPSGPPLNNCVRDLLYSSMFICETQTYIDIEYKFMFDECIS